MKSEEFEESFWIRRWMVFMKPSHIFNFLILEQKFYLINFDLEL